MPRQPKIQHTVFFKFPDLEHEGEDYKKLQSIVKDGFCSIPGISASFARHGSLTMDKEAFLAHVDWPDRSGGFTHWLAVIGDTLDSMKAYLHSEFHKKDWMAAVGPYVKGIVVFDSELAVPLRARAETIMHSGLFKLQDSVTDDSEVMKQLQAVVKDFNKLPGIKASFRRHGTAALNKEACLKVLDWPDKTDGFTHYLCVVCDSPAALKTYLHGEAHKAWVPVIRPNFVPDAAPPSLIFDNPLPPKGSTVAPPLKPAAAGATEIKVTAKRSAVFYSRAVSSFLKGVEARPAEGDKEAVEAKAPVDALRVSGLGDSINAAVAAAAQAEAEGLGTITCVQTAYPEMTDSGRGCSQIIIDIARKA
jgi:hypothetical protein